MTASLRDRVLMEALGEIPEAGFSAAVLTRAGERAGATKREMLDAFPSGATSLVEAFSHWADARMSEALAIEPAPRMRDRIRAAVKLRIEALTPYKDAARRAAAFLALPQHAALAARLSMRSVDLMWRAAGDRASDFSYYTKRAILGGVYTATLLYWLSDSSEAHAATWAFLDGRIQDAMTFESLRKHATETLSKFPNPLEILSRLRSR